MEGRCREVRILGQSPQGPSTDSVNNHKRSSSHKIKERNLKHSITHFPLPCVICADVIHIIFRRINHCNIKIMCIYPSSKPWRKPWLLSRTGPDSLKLRKKFNTQMCKLTDHRCTNKKSPCKTSLHKRSPLQNVCFTKCLHNIISLWQIISCRKSCLVHETIINWHAIFFHST